MKSVPQADAKSASMGWLFDPGFIQNVQRVAADVECPSMESIDSVLFALREMGYIRTAETCEHGFSVDECVTGLCELQTENEALRARVARLEEVLKQIADGYIRKPICPRMDGTIECGNHLMNRAMMMGLASATLRGEE